MIWTFFVLIGSVLVGIVGLAMLGSLKDPEHVTISLSMAVLPKWLVGFVVSAAIAALMSTVDSQLLVIATSIIEDFYNKMLNKKATQEKLVWMSRVVTVIIGVLAFFLALNAKELVYSLVLYAWGGLAASFGPAVILSLWWKKTTKWGIFAGMLVGSITIVIWHNVPFLAGFVYELVPAFIFSCLSIIFISGVRS